MSASSNLPAATDGHSALRSLRPILWILFLVYLIMGLGLPVVPLHGLQVLHLDASQVGLVSGCLFAASVLLRMQAGQCVDGRGAHQALRIGLWAGVGATAGYLVCWACGSHTAAAVLALTLAQVLLGAATSFTATGALGWGVARLGPARAGLVMSWAGTAMFLAFAVGAPAGSLLWRSQGFGVWVLAIGLLAALSLVALRQLPATPKPAAAPSAQASLLSVVAWPGLGLALASVGFAAITAFSAWLYKARGWDMGWQALSAFSAAVVVSRMALGHLPDRWGGARVALGCAALETLGLAQLGLAATPAWAALGAAMAGIGFGLLFPALGVEAVRRAAPQRRGTAMGLYAAFLDLALALASPMLGLVGAAYGLDRVYLTAAGCAALAAAVAWALRHEHRLRAAW